jgi:4,5-DOPA dioxygenase extradiol
MTLSDLSPRTDRMPVLFVGHGSPMNAIEENEFTAGWRQVAASLPAPAAILCISAHWETRGTRVTAMEHPRTIHDFGGFPRELYQVSYPAPGDPALAAQTIDTVSSVRVEPDQEWGLDHGCWSVIKHLYPKADIPVVQMSMDYTLSPQRHYELAGELAHFRNRGVLIVGSGNMVHNLRMVAWDKLNEPGFGFDWALEANEKMKQLVLQHDHRALCNYGALGRAFDLAVPTPDHFIPLLYVLALQADDEKVSFFNDKAVAGSLTMTGVRIDPQS